MSANVRTAEFQYIRRIDTFAFPAALLVRALYGISLQVTRSSETTLHSILLKRQSYDCAAGSCSLRIDDHAVGPGRR